MDNPIVSIVLPVYQVEEYISDCIHSILNQTFSDFELVIVDDGTKDNSINIVYSLLSKSEIQFRIIKQENQGISAARNAGINAASGKFVICIDSDDIIHRDCVRLLYESAIINDCSICFCDHVQFEGITIPDYNEKYSNSIVVEQKKLLLKFLHRDYEIRSTSLLCNKLFLMANNLSYDERCGFSEDQKYIWECLFTIDKATYVESKLYYYRKRPGSAMTSSKYDKIKNGYKVFTDLENELLRIYPDKKEIIINIVPRWVLGVLYSSAKLLKWEEYQKFAIYMNYKNRCCKVLKEGHTVERMAAMIAWCSLRLYYKLSNTVLHR